jgi:ribokinase
VVTLPIIEANVAGCEIVRCAVVGHVEWVEFARVPYMPAAGSIVHASETTSEPAGGGAVVARQLALLAGRCELFTALGSDELGRSAQRRLAELGIDVHVQWGGQTRRAWTHVDDDGERTITVLGDKLRPSRVRPEDLLDHDAVLFISGETEALLAARRARVLVAVARELPILRQGGVELDALVGSGEDDGERYHAGDLAPPPKLVVTTSGSLGGWTQPGGPYRAAPLPGPVSDAYGCGDSFAAALTFALARGDEAADAVTLAARCGAAVMTGRGPYERQLTGAEL